MYLQCNGAHVNRLSFKTQELTKYFLILISLFPVMTLKSQNNNPFWVLTPEAMRVVANRENVWTVGRCQLSNSCTQASKKLPKIYPSMQTMLY